MNRQDEMRKRHHERKRKVMAALRPDAPRTTAVRPDSAAFSDRQPTGWKDGGMSENRQPFGFGGRFIIQCVCAGLMAFAVYWLVGQEDGRYNRVREWVETAMTQEFRFAAVAAWYEANLGRPVGFLPDTIGDGSFLSDGRDTTETDSSEAFAVPVSGEVTDRFNHENNGITFRTAPNAAVEAARGGQVVFVGERDKTGRTVIIQHQDSSESWYGKLDQIDVKVYEFVRQGQKIGTTSDADGSDGKGSFYFALKEGENFIDPIQVISLD